MSKETAGTLARRLGFTPLKSSGSYFKSEPSLFDGKPVGLMLSIARASVPGKFHYALVTDGGKTVVRGIGAGHEIERHVTVALILHEAHELRKEAAT